MRGLRAWTWAAVIAGAAAPSALAQQTTGSTGGARTTTTTIGTGTGGITGGGSTGGVSLGGGSALGGGLTGGGRTTGGGGTGGGGTGGTPLPVIESAPQIMAPTGTASSSLDRSNRFAGYYANPYFQGNTTSTSTMPGGFGIATTTGSSGGATSGRGAIGGTGALGGGIGGRGLGTQSAANQSGILIPLPSQIAYTARMQFPTPPVASAKITAEVRAVVDAAVANPKAIQVITDANNNVILRGNAKDDEEARLVEGIVRLTPGVGAIKNELAYPVAANR